MSTHLSASSSATIRRRSIVRGVAWATPTIMLAAAAPSMAASPPATISVNGQVTYSRKGNSDNYDLLVSNASVELSRLRAGDLVTGVCYSLWYPLAGIPFTHVGAAGGWSTPVVSGASKVEAGVTYYEYSSCYTGVTSPISASGTLTVPVVGWISSEPVKNVRGTSYQVCATGYVNGVRLDDCSLVVSA